MTQAFDLVVIGAGGAGLSTALFAALEGARVLIVERTGLVGGTTAWSAGTSWIPGSHHSAQVNPQDTLDEAKRYLDNAVGDLTKIAGQKPVVTKAKKAIAGFKIREGQAIGCMVTLRGVRMYEFLDRFVTIALPRVRDFRGISGRAFDGRGNYNIGVKEQIIFPEIEYDKVDALRGLNISITTTAKSDEECKALLAGFRFPFKN